jgi:AbrB family looped-hinge helix DNA binding protein
MEPAFITISSKYQIVIPRSIRESLGLTPGRRLVAFRHGERIELVPYRTARDLRGSLRGIDTTVPRDGDRT